MTNDNKLFEFLKNYSILLLAHEKYENKDEIPISREEMKNSLATFILNNFILNEETDTQKATVFSLNPVEAATLFKEIDKTVEEIDAGLVAIVGE